MRLFAEQGYQGTTMKQVADEASVSEQTIYNVFGDKVGLLVGVGMHAMASGDGGNDAALFDALQAEPDPVARIEMVARYSQMQWQEGALELDLMLSSPDIKDQRLADLAEQALAYRLELNQSLCGLLFPDAIRRPGVSVEEIATFATAVDSAATITTFRKLGWSMERYGAWIAQVLQLFLDPGAVSAHNDPETDG